MNDQDRIELCSEHPDLCNFPKGNYFDYVRFISAFGRHWIIGKGRAGCVTKVDLTADQARDWVRKYRYLKSVSH